MYILEFRARQSITGLGVITDVQPYPDRTLYRIRCKWHRGEDLTEYETDRRLQKLPIKRLVALIKIGTANPNSWEAYAVERITSNYKENKEFKQRIDSLDKSDKELEILNKIL